MLQLSWHAQGVRMRVAVRPSGSALVARLVLVDRQGAPQRIVERRVSR